MIVRALLPYALTALVGGAGVWWVMDLRADLTEAREAHRAALRELSTMQAVAEQSAMARDVARAEADRLRTRAAEYDQIREFILRGDDNAPLPPILRDVLDRLLRRDAH